MHSIVNASKISFIAVPINLKFPAQTNENQARMSYQSSRYDRTQAEGASNRIGLEFDREKCDAHRIVRNYLMLIEKFIKAARVSIGLRINARSFAEVALGALE